MMGNMKRQYQMWTTREMARLRDSYPKMSAAELLLEFAPRSMRSIHSMANIMKVRKRRDWKAIARRHVAVVFSFGVNV